MLVLCCRHPWPHSRGLPRRRPPWVAVRRERWAWRRLSGAAPGRAARSISDGSRVTGRPGRTPRAGHVTQAAGAAVTADLVTQTLVLAFELSDATLHVPVSRAPLSAPEAAVLGRAPGEEQQRREYESGAGGDHQKLALGEAGDGPIEELNGAGTGVGDYRITDHDADDHGEQQEEDGHPSLQWHLLAPFGAAVFPAFCVAARRSRRSNGASVEELAMACFWDVSLRRAPGARPLPDSGRLETRSPGPRRASCPRSRAR